MSESFDVPIFHKTYELYKEIYGFRNTLPKQDRYAIWLKVENTTLEVLEAILIAISLSKNQKSEVLENASKKLNILRIFIRISKDVRAIDDKKYLSLQEKLDEIGRMLGGWIKSTKTP
jgi:four helix bundle protein